MAPSQLTAEDISAAWSILDGQLQFLLDGNVLNQNDVLIVRTVVNPKIDDFLARLDHARQPVVPSRTSTNLASAVKRDAGDDLVDFSPPTDEESDGTDQQILEQRAVHKDLPPKAATRTVDGALLHLPGGKSGSKKATLAKTSLASRLQTETLDNYFVKASDKRSETSDENPSRGPAAGEGNAGPNPSASITKVKYSSKAMAILKAMGWDEKKGLGPKGEGRTSPVNATPFSASGMNPLAKPFTSTRPRPGVTWTETEEVVHDPHDWSGCGEYVPFEPEKIVLRPDPLAWTWCSLPEAPTDYRRVPTPVNDQNVEEKAPWKEYKRPEPVSDAVTWRKWSKEQVEEAEVSKQRELDKIRACGTPTRAVATTPAATPLAEKEPPGYAQHNPLSIRTTQPAVMPPAGRQTPTLIQLPPRWPKFGSPEGTLLDFDEVCAGKKADKAPAVQEPIANTPRFHVHSDGVARPVFDPKAYGTPKKG